MPLNPNILALLRQGMTGNAQSNAPQGIDPNLEMILQGMGMMPRRLDMQGRPIVGGVENPSNMDQHYARQGNPEAMRQRYSSPTFAMGPNDPNRRAPATPMPPQGAITARQPVTGLPGQVGPAYGMQQTPINMFPSPEEGDAMDNVRKQYRQTMQQGRTSPIPWRPNDQIQPQGPPIDRSFGVPTMPSPAAPAEWQGPPVPSIQQEASNINDTARRQWEASRLPRPIDQSFGVPSIGNPFASFVSQGSGTARSGWDAPQSRNPSYGVPYIGGPYAPQGESHDEAVRRIMSTPPATRLPSDAHAAAVARIMGDPVAKPSGSSTARSGWDAAPITNPLKYRKPRR